MTDIRELDPVEAVLVFESLQDHLGRLDSRERATDFLRVGITDVDLVRDFVLSKRDHGSFFPELQLLAEAGARVDDPAALLEHLGYVGHAVFAREPQNLDLWLTVARTAVGTTRWNHQRLTDVNAAVYSGRGPDVVLQIARACAAAGLPISALGFDLDPSTVRSLVAAGVKSRNELERYLADDRITIVRVAELARAGVGPYTARAALHAGLALSALCDEATGLDERWFTAGRNEFDPSLLERVAFADLRTIGRAGWTTSEGVSLRDGDDGAPVFELCSSRLARFDVDGALELANAGLSAKTVWRYVDALTTGRPSLWGWNGITPERVAQLMALAAAEVAPSAIAAYRAGGAKGVQDILDARRHGITAARIAELRKAASTGRLMYTFRTVDQLIAAHERHP